MRIELSILSKALRTGLVISRVKERVAYVTVSAVIGR